jgi:hypothetical protein
MDLGLETDPLKRLKAIDREGIVQEFRGRIGVAR